jgi:Xaa-Pro aminopeptidase
MLSPETLPRIQSVLADAGLDGWLLYDFRGVNTIARALVGIEGMATRRWFVYIPATGAPTAITHGIEQDPWQTWPAAWHRTVYGAWRDFEAQLARLVGGRRVAMEYSPGDAVPYLDRIPAGVLEMVRATGATVVSSGELVSTFYATWSSEGLAAHRRAAETIARIAIDAFGVAAVATRGARPMGEAELTSWIRDRFERAGLETDHGPNVSVGAHAANPHYEPSPESSATIADGSIVLIDLWAREKGDVGIYADQTWMASLGAPSERAVGIWEAVRDARDAGIALVRDRVRAGEPVRGADVDRAARTVIEARGFGANFIHRLGHSIDSRELHGSGPNLDDMETRDERLLIPGIAFSIEPGIYLPGDIGMRSEVNAIVGERDVEITPRESQRDLIVA